MCQRCATNHRGAPQRLSLVVRPGDSVARCEQAPRSFPILPYDEAAAAWHGEERARQQKASKPAPFVDGEIAAVAHTNGLTLATLNPRHFKLFRHLQVEDWSDAC